MRLLTESLDSIVYEFNDVEKPPDLTVHPAPAELLGQLLLRHLLSEKLYASRPDLDRLWEIAHERHQSCQRVDDRLSCAFCLGNLACMAVARGEMKQAAQLAEESHRLASQLGLADLAARMDTIRKPANGG